MRKHVTVLLMQPYFLFRVPPPGSYRRGPTRMSNAHGGVFDIFRPYSLTSSISAILLSPLEFPSSSQSTRGRTGNMEGEVSDPPFSVPTLARNGPPFDTPFDTGAPHGGVAHFSFIPAGRLR